MTRITSSAGVLGGLLFLGLACYPLNRTGEVVSSRISTPALLGMQLGFLGLFVMTRPSPTRTAKAGFFALLAGFALMISGNVAEYWFLDDLPHEGRDGYARGIAFMTLLAGWLLTLVAATVAGVAMIRGGGGSPLWLSVPFVLALPLTIALGFVEQSWTGVPLGILSLLVSTFTFRGPAVR